ncbi:MAG: class I SAM-dependent methyltransferase [Pseudanabaenaceae cyanobacterium bins.39]|nr:class I SAM-dependent methyltransferase [Pseudanabaenaceae cyanobacterium bins.39]
MSIDLQNFLPVIHRNTFMRGELDMPCIPALIDLYMERLKVLFDTFGKSFSSDELDHLRSLLSQKLEEGFHISPLSKLVFRYEPSQNPNTGITYTITYAIKSITDQYNNWAATKQPPLFGSHADAMVMQVAEKLRSSQAVKVLDIGAGTGRNTFPLARTGCTVDAMEITSAFVEQIQATAQNESLPVQAIAADILDPLTRLKPFAYNLVICCEVTSHFRDVDQLRLLMAKVCDYLQHDGLFLFNIFLVKGDHVPSLIEKQMAELSWSTMFTEQELHSALADLPMEIIANDPVLDFERSNLPPEAWPPTGWFENWALGKDVFPLVEDSPMELRWILCKRS